MIRFFRVPVLCCALLLNGPAFAVAALDASHFELSAALVQKLKAAEGDMKLLPKKDEAAPDLDGDQSLEASIKKIDQDAQTSAVLAKHGLTSRELVMSAHALFHAGTFVSREQIMDKKETAAMFEGYTSEQKANIELVRGFLKSAKK